jgi:flagellar motility protein MotE (MotC chaperone)
MMDIIISISIYIIAAILLGFTFGWFIAKATFKEKFEEQIEVLSNNYDTNKNTIDNQSKKQLQEIEELKDEVRRLKQQHEKEVSAFLEERVDITMKYKKLLDKCKTQD